MKITLLTVEECPPCNQAKTLLRDAGIEYESVTPDSSRSRMWALMDISQRSQAPQLFIDDVFIDSGSAVPRYLRENLTIIKAKQ